MKRYNVWLTGRFTQWDEHPNGTWCKWEDVNKETIPTPHVHIVDEDSYDPRDRWAVYLNNLCMGVHSDKQNAENQVEYLKRALCITQ